ncbi:MAG: DUF362 domain-containing protein [Bacillota bacterium]
MSKVDRCVAAVRCTSYRSDELDNGLERLWEYLGADELVWPGATVLLKVNCLGPYAEEKGVTTHPAVVRALCRMVSERGARVQVGDSAGGATGQAFTHRALEISGIARVAREAGAEVVNFDARPAVPVENPRPGGPNPLYIAAAAREADVIINVAKLKTHLLTGLTAAVKNSFGCLPGAYKQILHREYPRVDEFSQVVLDISDVVGPRLHVVEAVVAMEGNGPSGGTLVECGLLLGARSALDADLAAALAAGWDPFEVSTNRAGRDRGLLQAGAKPLVVGDGLRTTCGRPLRRPLTAGWLARVPLPLLRLGVRLYEPALDIDAGLCNACGLCAQACPAQAMTVATAARIDNARCIRCYCCVELCSRQAARIVRRWRPRLGQHSSVCERQADRGSPGCR